MLFTDITQATAMTNDDVLYVLREQDMISTPDSVSGRMRAPATAKYKSRDGSSVAATTPRGGSSRRGRGGGPAADRKTKEDALAVPSEYRIHLDRDYINARAALVGIFDRQVLQVSTSSAVLSAQNFTAATASSLLANRQ